MQELHSLQLISDSDHVVQTSDTIMLVDGSSVNWLPCQLNRINQVPHILNNDFKDDFPQS